MLNGEFRPWGKFSWISSKLNIPNWDFIGCLGSEDRCITAAQLVKNNFNLNNTIFIDIEDKDDDFKAIIRDKTDVNERIVSQSFNNEFSIHRLNLLDSPLKIKEIIESFIDDSSGNIFLDISSFPKRYFFPILKLLQKSENISNLVVHYTVPEKYYDGDLANNPTPWNRLPMFQRASLDHENIKKAIVGVGFLPFGLPSLLKNDYSGAELTLIFPFPPGPPNYQRTWDFVREIDKFYPVTDDNRIVRVDVLDVNGCYEHLKSLTHDGSIPSIFAPYGPKTQSLAMALFAIKYQIDVYYTQPTQYHPDYSIGVKELNGAPEVYSYCIKLSGRNFY